MEQTTQTVQITPTPTEVSMPTSALMTTLMALVENYIKDIVSAQVNDILLSHTTMRVIDSGFDQKMKDIATEVVEEAISTHNDDEYHISESDIDDTVSTAINDYDFDDKFNDVITSAIDQIDLTEMIRTELKDNISFSISVD